MSKPAARLSDMHTCPMQTPAVVPIPHIGGPVLGPGVPTVLIGGMPAAVMGDMLLCIGPPDTIIQGVPVVLIGGKPAATMGSATAHGGTIILGCPTVLIGEGAAAEIQAMLGGKVSQEVIDMILRSPTLTNQLRDLQDAGWTVEMGVPGKGTFASRSRNAIVIDPAGDSSTTGVVQSLAHEAGHAVYPLPPEIPKDGLTRDEYVRRNTDRNLQDEGAATLNNMVVRDELNASGGPDIGIAGNTANAPAYEAAYAEYQRTGDDAQARQTIGNVFGHGEHPSTAPEMDYDAYYRRQYEERYGH